MLRFADLKRFGVVNNRVTLARWIATQGFPKPLRLGPNSLAWLKSEVEAWLAVRASDRPAA
jgi:prophage regulatory protein